MTNKHAILCRSLRTCGSLYCYEPFKDNTSVKIIGYLLCSCFNLSIDTHVILTEIQLFSFDNASLINQELLQIICVNHFCTLEDNLNVLLSAPSLLLHLFQPGKLT